MRRIKAIYLIPVCLVLLIGAAVGSYYLWFKPLLETVKKARADWDAARAACVQMEGPNEGDYQKALDEQQEYAKRIYFDYSQFKEIQATMPAVSNMAARYAADTKAGIYAWYNIMGKGELIKTLNQWVRSFHQPSAPSFSYAGTMGYEDTLPKAKMVSVDFGSMKLNVRGFDNLLNAFRRVTGYKYYPMIVTLPGDTATITLAMGRNDPRHDPNNPLLTMSYSATAFFLTQDWDPGENTAESIEKYKEQALTQKPHKRHRSDWTETPGETKPCPPVLFFIQPQPQLQP